MIGNSPTRCSLYRNEGNGVHRRGADLELGRESAVADVRPSSSTSKTTACSTSSRPTGTSRRINRVQPEDQPCAGRAPVPQQRPGSLNKRRPGSAALMTPVVARGAAHVDIDNDGGPGSESSPSTTGQRGCCATTRGAAAHCACRWSREVRTGRRSAPRFASPPTADGASRWSRRLEYLSRRAAILGLANGVQGGAVEIRWPSGQVDRLGPQDAGRRLVVTEQRAHEACTVRKVITTVGVRTWSDAPRSTTRRDKSAARALRKGQTDLHGCGTAVTAGLHLCLAASARSGEPALPCSCSSHSASCSPRSPRLDSDVHGRAWQANNLRRLPRAVQLREGAPVSSKPRSRYDGSFTPERVNLAIARCTSRLPARTRGRHRCSRIAAAPPAKFVLG